MAVRKIFEIYTEFTALVKEVHDNLHPEFQRRLSDLADVFVTARGLEIAESSTEFQERGVNSLEIKQELLDLFRQIYDEIESKKLLEPDDVASLWKLTEDLEESISYSGIAGVRSAQNEIPEVRASQTPESSIIKQ